MAIGTACTDGDAAVLTLLHGFDVLQDDDDAAVLTLLHSFYVLQDDGDAAVQHLDGAVLRRQVLRHGGVGALLGGGDARDVVDADPLGLLRRQRVVQLHKQHRRLATNVGQHNNVDKKPGVLAELTNSAAY